MDELVAINVLGTLDVQGPAGRVAIAGSVQRTVVARLAAAERAETVSREALSEALWGRRPPQTAWTTLRSHMARLRTRLREGGAPHAITTDEQGYRLRVAPESVDVRMFEERVARGHGLLRAGEVAAAIEETRLALELWRGEPFTGCRESAWTVDETARLKEIRLTAIETMLRARLARAEHATLIPALEQYVAQFPFREQFWEMLMTALYRGGRRADALGVYRRARALFATELGIEPGERLARLETTILNGEPVPDTDPPRTTSAGGRTSRRRGGRRGNLPAERTSFVGRQEELAEVKELLARARLLTLTGTGGVGKSRLAIRAAREVAGCFPGGVWFVELPVLRGPKLIGHELVGRVLAQALGLPGERASSGESVAARLRDARALLILDGCEHLQDACATVADRLLRACPQLHILVTSRHSLALPGEHVRTVLPLPPPREDDPQDAATTLFLQRAAAAVPLALRGEADRRVVAQICRRLDGIPLAIELAAVRLRVLSPRELLRRLERRLPTLEVHQRGVSPRHQTLRATIDWSFNLCTPHERRLWAQLSVLTGSFDLAAVESVCGKSLCGEPVYEEPMQEEPVPVLSVVDGLVDKSVLIREEHAGSLRFRMLDSLREYGAEHLSAAGRR